MPRHYRDRTKHQNGASITSGSLSLTVGTLLQGQGLSGASFPYTVAVYAQDVSGNLTSYEEMDVTGGTYPTVTVTRGINSTTAVAHDTTHIIAQVVGTNDLDTFLQYAPPPSGDTSGVTDTANLQAALNAIPAGGGTLRLPAGVYTITGLTVPNPTTLIGAGVGDAFSLTVGNYGTVINCTSSTANAIQVNACPFTAQGFALKNTAGSTPTAGAGIVDNLGATGFGLKLSDVHIFGFYICLDVKNAEIWTMDRCQIHNPVLYGVRINDLDTPDGGDMGILNSYFYPGPTNMSPAAMIRYESGGGLRFLGNKINGNPAIATYGLEVAVADGVVTSDLLCTGNSIENAGTCIRVHLKGGSNTGQFRNIVLVGNELAPGGSGTGIAVTAEATGKITAVVIDDNAIADATTGITLSNVDNVAVGLNVFTSVTTPLTVGANVTNLVQSGTGSGTVTSVGLSAPSSILSVGGSPVTGSGTLALTLATQLANTVFAGPTTGGATTPTIRALVQADIPDLSSLYQPVGSTGTGTDHLHGLARWVAGGGATFEAPDLIEYIQMVFDNGSAVDESTVTLSADRTQLVFDSAPTTGHVLQCEYVIARI